MSFFTPPSSTAIHALCPGFYLGSEVLRDDLRFAYSRDLNASVLVSRAAVDEPVEIWGVFKISRDSFTFTPTVGYDMINKPVYDVNRGDDVCWRRLRPAVNLLAHGHETILDGRPADWERYTANLKSLEKLFKDSPKGASSGTQPARHHSVLLETWGLKLTHRFLVEQRATVVTSDSEDEGEQGGGSSSAGSLPLEFMLEGWPVPESWNSARQDLLAKNFAIQPLNAYVHGSDRLIHPSRYERRLKGAVVHVSFVLHAYNFVAENRVRFSAVAQKITVLAPASYSPPVPLVDKEKRKAPELEAAPAPKKTRRTSPGEAGGSATAEGSVAD
ncbi:hypothetical protein M378DRAFT_179615 [Amanita muscaria Koide BX008]|uniref:Uncharacterized protein n=1 Tax=Amanita muscaria (strain Koide BX008) TaxID=946122 RepID=A0A0C2X1P4_AMAMK|nr:hypothetical protein M378DRAFT_179615 [Amanita muscaria Koide BX008]